MPLIKDMYEVASPEMADLARAALTGEQIREELDISNTKLVRNLMSNKLVRIPKDTPRCCDPSSEQYWSM